MYKDKNLSPMLIGEERAAFDDPDYIYELKLDGVRCLAYIDSDGVELRNKRNLKLNEKFPELKDIYKQVKKKCILDGELYVYKDGLTDFFEIQKRALTSDRFKIRLASRKYPATFTAFDILYLDEDSLLEEPLMKRKKLLDKLIKENGRINISRYIEEKGTELFALTKERSLEGIVAKRRDSRYHQGKRTKEWIKCKNLLDDDFVICGYIPKEKNFVSLVLGQYRGSELVYKGHVTLGVSLEYLYQHSRPGEDSPFHQLYESNVNAVWITPMLTGSVRFMMYTEQGSLRQPVFKGFRNDKQPQDCVDTWYLQNMKGEG